MTNTQFVLPDFLNNDDIECSFRPFVRCADSNTFYEKLKRVILTFTLLPIRVICLIVIGLIGYLISLILIKTDNKTTNYLIWWRRILYSSLPYFGLCGLWVYGIFKIKRTYLNYEQMHEMYGINQKPPNNDNQSTTTSKNNNRSCVIVSNHIGFVEIFAFLHHFKASFIAKEGVKYAPFVGIMAQCIQTLFLQSKENKKATKSLTEQITERINLMNAHHNCNHCNGAKCVYCIFQNLVIFPEGTTTNGDSLIAFRTGIFHASANLKHENKAVIRPIAIYSDNTQVSVSYDSISFFDLTYKLLTQFSNNLNMLIAPPYIPNEQELNDPLLYARNVNILISKMLNRSKTIYVLNRKHKMDCYLEYLKLKMQNNNEIDQKSYKYQAMQIFKQDQTLKKYI